jgi:hypothetical protein
VARYKYVKRNDRKVQKGAARRRNRTWNRLFRETFEHWIVAAHKGFSAPFYLEKLSLFQAFSMELPGVLSNSLRVFKEHYDKKNPRRTLTWLCSQSKVSFK